MSACVCVCGPLAELVCGKQTHKSAIRDKTTFFQCEAMSPPKILKEQTILIQQLVELFVRNRCAPTPQFVFIMQGELRTGFEHPDQTVRPFSSGVGRVVPELTIGGTAVC